MTGRLLLIEDDSTVGEVLRSSLRTHGHEVSWEQTGLQGLDRAAKIEFDLVLLDLGLPDLDGVEVCRRLRAEQPGTVLVMATDGATSPPAPCRPLHRPGRPIPTPRDLMPASHHRR